MSRTLRTPLRLLLRLSIAMPLALSPAPGGSALARTYLIEYHGDSTVWGYASGSDGARVARPAPQVFADVVKTRLQVEVLNKGINGGTACALLEGVPGGRLGWNEQMRASRAHFVILNHGINDQWKYDPGAYRDCLRSLALVARKHGKRVIFETPNPTRDSGAGGLDVYVDAMRTLAREEGIPVIDQYRYLSEQLKGRSPLSFAPDGLHPADAIYVLKGTFAAQAFLRLLGR